jgi:peptidoglycan/xylan/chitin deacetylase (PgdA/CDA1 family)
MPAARVVIYAATCVALALVFRSIIGRPPPLAIASGLAVAYVALFMAGVLFIRLRMFVDALVRGPRGARGVALTFDDGPHPVHTRKVLDALDEHGAKATFFVVAKKAERHPELVKEIVARGHALGLHSYAHARLMAMWPASRIRADLEKGLEILERITGERPSLYRPPIGHSSPTLARVVDELDLVTVGWTVSGHDGVASAREERVAARVAGALADGVIVALHDAPEHGDREPAGVRALPEILAAVRAAKLEITPLAAWADE